MPAAFDSLLAELMVQIRQELFEDYMFDMALDFDIGQPNGIARMNYGTLISSCNKPEERLRWILDILHVDNLTRGIAIDLFVAESYLDSTTETFCSDDPAEPLSNYHTVYVRDWRLGDIKRKEDTTTWLKAVAVSELESRRNALNSCGRRWDD